MLNAAGLSAKHFEFDKALEKASRMNRTEAQYANQLELLKKAGVILDYGFEILKFNLGNNCWYTPDFIIIYPNSLAAHEVKGFMRDDAAVKIKTAARLYPWIEFWLIRKVKKNFETTYVKP